MPPTINAQPPSSSPGLRSRAPVVFPRMRFALLSKPHAPYIYCWHHVNSTITLAIIMDTNWFQQTLERAGASQADLARHLRLAASAVSRMLKGERQMKLLEAVQIAAFRS